MKLHLPNFTVYPGKELDISDRYSELHTTNPMPWLIFQYYSQNISRKKQKFICCQSCNPGKFKIYPSQFNFSKSISNKISYPRKMSYILFATECSVKVSTILETTASTPLLSWCNPSRRTGDALLGRWLLSARLRFGWLTPATVIFAKFVISAALGFRYFCE